MSACVSPSLCMYVCKYIYTHIHTHIYICVCMCVCVRARALKAKNKHYHNFKSLVMHEGRKEMFYLTTHSIHFIYGYMASDIG